MQSFEETEQQQLESSIVEDEFAVVDSSLRQGMKATLTLLKKKTRKVTTRVVEVRQMKMMLE